MSPSRQRYLAAQAAATGKPIKDRFGFVVATPPRQRRIRPQESKRPAFGSQEWAETRGDDLGLSADY